MSSERNLCVEILEILQNNDDRQTVLTTQVIYQDPLTVVVLAFEFDSGRYHCVAGADAQCNSEDEYSKAEGYLIASKRAMRLIADVKEVREFIVATFDWLIGVWQ